MRSVKLMSSCTKWASCALIGNSSRLVGVLVLNVSNTCRLAKRLRMKRIRLLNHSLEALCPSSSQVFNNALWPIRGQYAPRSGGELLLIGFSPLGPTGPPCPIVSICVNSNVMSLFCLLHHRI